MKYQHEELIQTTQQKDKRIEELELNQNDLQHDLQTKDFKIQNLKEMKGKADFKLVNPVCPGGCGDNIPLENMIEHFRSCKYSFEFIYTCLKLNTEVKFTYWYNKREVYKLEKSRDLFITKIHYFNGDWVFYIMHCSEEETKYVFYYSIKSSEDDNYIKPLTVRCAPMGISLEDAVYNNFTTKCPSTNMKFTMYKA